MHNLTKIKLFRILLALTYPLAILFVYPFALCRRKSKGHHFFFFDRYVIGGAQIVHIDILNSLPELHKEVYFTRYSPNNKLKEKFYSIANTKCRDIHVFCDNLLFRLFTVHYYAFYINRHKNAVVFSSNSTFFYDMLFFINREVITAELLHNFTYGNNGMEFFGLANHRYLNYRLTVDVATLKNIKTQYREYNIPEAYCERLNTIEPAVIIPAKVEKDLSLPLQVLYAGRGTPQKRVHLLDRIAAQCIREGKNIRFHFAGTMADELSDYVQQNSMLHGEIGDKATMYKLYYQSHVIILTSAYEGFPMVVKEGMANGCVPVVTALEGLKIHLQHEKNALLIETPEDEAGVVTQGIALLNSLANDKNELAHLSAACYEYAVANFTLAVFTKKYREFFKLS